MKQVLINLLTKLLTILKPDVFKREITSINKQDIDLINKAFPMFTYKAGMSSDELCLQYMRSEGEQRVINYLLSRIRGRIGQGVAYD